jgi:hypothetical protein
MKQLSFGVACYSFGLCTALAVAFAIDGNRAWPFGLLGAVFMAVRVAATGQELARSLHDGVKCDEAHLP